MWILICQFFHKSGWKLLSSWLLHIWFLEMVVHPDCDGFCVAIFIGIEMKIEACLSAIWSCILSLTCTLFSLCSSSTFLQIISSCSQQSYVACFNISWSNCLGWVLVAATCYLLCCPPKLFPSCAFFSSRWMPLAPLDLFFPFVWLTSEAWHAAFHFFLTWDISPCKYWHLWLEKFPSSSPGRSFNLFISWLPWLVPSLCRSCPFKAKRCEGKCLF